MFSQFGYRVDQSTLRQGVIVLSIFLFLVVLSLSGVESLMQTQFKAALVPISRWGATVIWWIDAPRRVLIAQASEYQSMAQLRHIAIQSQHDSVELQRLREENEQLRSLLSLPLASGSATRGVPVLSFAQPTVSIQSTESVMTGAAVSNSGILLGVVQSVEAGRAQVTLLHQSTLPPILVRTDTGMQGLLKGDGRRVLVVALDPHGSVTVSSKVSTVGQPGIPAGLLVGSIQDFQHSPTDPEQRAVLSTPLQFYDVLVVDVFDH